MWNSVVLLVICAVANDFINGQIFLQIGPSHEKLLEVDDSESTGGERNFQEKRTKEYVILSLSDARGEFHESALDFIEKVESSTSSTLLALPSPSMSIKPTVASVPDLSHLETSQDLSSDDVASKLRWENGMGKMKSDVDGDGDGDLTSTASTYQHFINVLEPPPTHTALHHPSFIFDPHIDSEPEKVDDNNNAEVVRSAAQIKIPASFGGENNYQSVNMTVNKFMSSKSMELPFDVRAFAQLPIHEPSFDDIGNVMDVKPPRFVAKEENGHRIEFASFPEDEPYQMSQLGLSDGLYIFSYLGQFLSFIQPYDFPVEFVRDALWNKLSIFSLILQALEVEAGFVACVTVGVLTSLIIPSFALASSCSTLCAPPSSHKLSRKSVSNASIDSEISCSRKTHAFTLFVLVLIIGAGVVALIVTNEQLSSAMLGSPQVVSTALSDITTYIKNTHRQVSHVTLSAFDRTLSALYADLNDVDDLLGKPIQSQVAAETGVDVALDALVDVATASHALSEKVAEMQDANLKMRGMMAEARDRLSDLRAQVEALRRTCHSRDRPLCDTIESSGLEITLRTDPLNTDPRLSLLRSMAGGNLPVLAEHARSQFSNIPVDIARATRNVRDEIRRDLDVERALLDSALWPFESLTRDLQSRVSEAREIAQVVEDTVNNVEQWRWLALFCTALLVLLIWLLLVIALIYICCGFEGKARSMLIASLVNSSLLSVFLWAIALSIMLVGGHGEVFVCRPLYDQPNYKALSELLDDPGVLYERGGGFFKNLVPRNYTLTVSLATALQECDDNRAAFKAFQLNEIVNVERASDFRTWGNVLDHMKNLNGNFSQLHFLDTELQEKLHNLLQAAAVNMTAHRTQLSRPITGRDLLSFSKQLDSVANQIKDLTTVARVEALASRTRRLISQSIQPIEEKKEELVYQVTALEMLIQPLQRQANQSLSHLKTIQYYIDNQGSNISQMKALDYSRRLTGYLTQYREQLSNALQHRVGLCRPLFELFHGLRHHMCRHIMDPLNGYWFALVWCLLSLTAATPVCIRLIYYYGLQRDGLLDNNSGSVRSETQPGTVWVTPGNDVEIENVNW